MSRSVLVPTTVVSDRTWTVSEVERWPDHLRFEILDGVLYMAAAPYQPHPIVVDNIDDILGTWVRQHQLGRVLGAQTGLYLTEINYLDPDLVFVRRSQIPSRGQRYTCAALAVEVLSPSNLRAPREVREERYRKVGVEEIWYVDHEARTLEVRRPAGAGYETAVVFRDEDEVSSPLFPGLAFPLPALWVDTGD